jgi:UDP-N-acetylmuramate dehydrogenase
VNASALHTLHTQLSELLSEPPLRSEPLAKHTSFRIGGPAAVLATVNSVAELQGTLELTREAGLPLAVLGKGTNLLAADAGFPGVVLQLGAGLEGAHVEPGGRLLAGGGTPLAAVVRMAQSCGLAGTERLLGIPGTVGAAVVGNVGSGQEWIAPLVRRVRLFVPGEGLRTLQAPDISWRYRDSSLRDVGIVTEVEFLLESGDTETLTAEATRALRRRCATQPLKLPNAGCIFKNPRGKKGPSAGRLIEEAGVKGLRIGDAQVSEQHANFIVNLGAARARDVCALMQRAIEGVKASSGIQLEAEIRFLGSFEAPFA